MKATLRCLGLLVGLFGTWLVAPEAAAGQEFGPPSNKKNVKFKDAIKISTSVMPTEAKRGETVTLKITMKTVPGYHTYPTYQPEPLFSASVNVFEFKNTDQITWVGKLEEPKPEEKIDEKGRKTLEYFKEVIFGRQFIVRPQTPPGKITVTVPAKVLVCHDNGCLPPEKVNLSAALTILEGEVPVDPKYAEEVAKASAVPPPAGPPPTEAGPPAGREESLSSDRRPFYMTLIPQLQAQALPQESGLLAFILAGVFWGAISLVTPCVFPMIPITVSFFLKQSDKEHHRPLTMALVYCLTIVIVLTIAAVTLLSFFSWLSVRPGMNFALGALFIVFALSLFGMYDIELPSGLARFTSTREGKGGFVGTVFMALTFTIVSFACVAPFLGGFGGTAESSNLTLLEKMLGGLAFSATFASPFFVLALFPSLLRRLPKSGSWLNTVKVVMGFLELAAALKFLRAGELVMLNGKSMIFTYDLVLGIWIALSFLCGLYLLGLYRLPHDTPTEHLSVPRLVVSLLFLGLGLYLVPALFKTGEGEKQRPHGAVYAWIDSFLLPEPGQAKRSELDWSGDLRAALQNARDHRQRTGQRKLVFIDFTGVTCSNCRKNEEDVFPIPEIKDAMGKYELVQLYTDTVPAELYPPRVRDKLNDGSDRQSADAAANKEFQGEAFGTTQLPLYVILEPLAEGGTKLVKVYPEGLINDSTAFARFLKEPLEAQVASGKIAARTNP